MMVTDPPITASGVTKIYMQYNAAALHSAQSSSAGGWMSLNARGIISVPGLVAGQQYLVTCICGDTAASTTVVAG